MKSILHKAASLLVALTISTAAVTPALADEMNWTFDTSDITDDIQVQLYSQSDDQEWPEQERVWTIYVEDYVSNFTISCVYQEEICYGAWVKGDSTSYWGTGYKDRYNDSSACHVCGFEKNVTVKLLE